MKSLPNITSLRFFLAFLVLIYHVRLFFNNRGLNYFNETPFFNKGTEAVYVFFSLSGFLIIRLLYLEKETTNTVQLRKFFKRRILRIFPLYYLVLTIGFVYYRIILPKFGYPDQSNYDFLEALFLSITFFPNILFTYCPGGIIEILWSIGIEEQFYLVIAPLILWIPQKKIAPTLLIFTICYFALFFNINLIFLKNYQMLFFYFSFSGLVSIISLKSNFVLRVWKFRFVFYTLFIIYFITSVFKSNFSNILYHLFGMILFGMTICFLVEKPIILLENKTLKYLGKISYGIYMLNVIVIQFVGFIYLKILLKFNLSVTTSILIVYISTTVITIFIAHLSYKYFENFFLKFKNEESKNY
jgi:peptidoglycan/LPS O-acetylase OafA/YrhL